MMEYEIIRKQASDIAAIRAELARVTAERDALKKAVEYYADDSHWDEQGYYEGSEPAKRALEATK